MKILAIDPGPHTGWDPKSGGSAWVVWDGKKILAKSSGRPAELTVDDVAWTRTWPNPVIRWWFRRYYGRTIGDVWCGYDKRVKTMIDPLSYYDVDLVAIEMIQSFGMAVGKSTFDTVRWIGIFEEALRSKCVPVQLVYRPAIKSHLCRSGRAKDANVRQALIDRFGEPGKKSAPGSTYGLSGDAWSAFAIAVTVYDQISETSVSAGGGPSPR